MKRIYYLGLLLCQFNSFNAVAQTWQYGTVIIKNSYQGSSLKALNSITLLPGFEVSAGNTFSALIASTANPYPLSTNQQNYIKTTVLQKEGKKTESDVMLSPASDRSITYEYQDGFGRTIQQVAVKSSPSGHDMVQPIEYDSYGQQSKRYLPYTSASESGEYHPDAALEQNLFYNTDNDKIANSNNPYAISKYDNSPVQFLLEQGSAGEDWQPGTGHTRRQEFGTNTVNDHVIIYNADGPQGEYAAATLSKNRIIDENKHEVLLFKDKQGHLILKKVQLDGNVTGDSQAAPVSYLETYYIYNDYGNLIFQVPPKASSKLAGTSNIWGDSFIDKNLFSYTYDQLGRLIKKKMPGIDPVYICYDQFNRPVLVQDGKLRQQDKWYFIKYDMGDRPVMEGIYTYEDLGSTGNTKQEKLQTYLKQLNYTTSPGLYYEEKLSGTAHGYSNQAFPSKNTKLLNVYYYDDYDFNADGVADYSYTSQTLPDEPTDVQGSAFGNLTCSKSNILGTSDWIMSISLFDKKGRIVQVRSNNHLSLTPDNLATSVYSFNSTVKITKVYHKAGTGLETAVINKYNYDQAGRLLSCYQNNNNVAQDQLVAKYEYNELGQLVDKKLHETTNGTFLQSIDYRYNIRGWLTHINNSSLTADNVNNDDTNDLFGMELLYNNGQSALTDQPSTNLNWNGNITAVKWKVQPSATSIQNSNTIRERSYIFAYDKANRLTSASYQALSGTTWNAEQNGYNESAAYDENGNILALRRNTINSDATGAVQVDNLQYTYDDSGNQLKKVEDVASNAIGFKNLVSTNDEYGYDENGNMNRDDNKGISQITYNEINKISQITFTDGRKITYQYASNGVRVSKSAYKAGSTIAFLTTDYVSGFVYENHVLSYFAMPEGRVRASGSSLTYEYYIKDNQGNVRVSFESYTSGGITSAKLTQENHYYPFGLSMSGIAIRTAQPTTPNKNLYNGGSELQNDFDDDPNMYSTFYREYDPVLGRMSGIDPMADKYASSSIYNYSFNNPVNLNDPTGSDPYNWRDPYGGYPIDYGDPNYNEWESPTEAYGETFEELINKQYGGDPWAMISAFYNSTPGGTNFSYVPTGDSFASAQMYNYGVSGNITYYTIGAYYEHDSSGMSVIKGGVSGEVTQVTYDNRIDGKTNSAKTSNLEEKNIDWYGVVNASLGVVGGVAETALGAATAEFGIGVYGIVDGGSRTLTNSVRLAAYLSGHNEFGDAVPSNLGALTGKLIDGNNDFYKVGGFQNSLGMTNDFVTFYLTGSRFEYNPQTWAVVGGLASDTYTAINTYFQMIKK